MAESFDIAVVGGGAAGTMAALRAVLHFRRTLLVTGDLDAKRRSRAQWVSAVDDMPVFSGRSHPLAHSLQEVLQWLEGQEELKSRLTVVKASIHTLIRRPADFVLHWTEKHRRNPVGTPHEATARHVVLATGIMDIQPHIQGSIEPIFSFANANQVLYCLRSDGHRVIGRRTAVIGHTDEAAWTAIVLHERYAPPHLEILTHGQALQGSAETKRLLELYGIGIRTGTIEGIAGHARKGGLEGFIVDGEQVPIERAFVALGHLVYHELARQVGAELDEAGYIVTTPTGESSIPGLYVVGDLQAGRKKQIYTAWDMAVDAVDDIDRRLREERRRALLEAARQG